MHRLVGLVLNRRNTGNADRRISLLAVDGKHELRARGTQKLESKLAGSLEPLTLVDVTVVQGRAGEQVTGSSIRDSYRSIHSNVSRIAGAALLAGTVDQLVRGRLDEPAVFKITREAFVLLGRAKTNRNVLLSVAYGLWNMLTELGYGPSVTTLRTTAPVKRLVSVLLLKNPNVIRRVRCSVPTARLAVELALIEVVKVSDREIPAATFFRHALTVRPTR